MADIIRPAAIDHTGGGMIYNAYKLIDQIKKRGIAPAGGSCIDWVESEAKKRGWDLNKLSTNEAKNYVKLHKYCERRRSKKYKRQMRDLKRRQGGRFARAHAERRKGSVKLRNPGRHAVGTVRGGRTSRYLASLKESGIKRLVKETLNEEINKVAMAAVWEWAKDQGKEMLRDDVVVERLQRWAQKILENPTIRGGQLGAYATKIAGGALTAYAAYQMYQDMSEMIGDPNKSAEWNDGVASGLEIVGAGLAKHGMPSSPRYWGVDSCDDLHGFALKNACARWERKEQIATSPKAAERQGGGEQWQGRIFPPLRKGGGWRTYQELTRRERQDPKNYEKWIAWRKETGRQT